MVGIIVYDGDTARTADDLEAAARAAETAQPVPYLFHGQAYGRADDHGGARVKYVVSAKETKAQLVRLTIRIAHHK
jgi:hypothetical protein